MTDTPRITNEEELAAATQDQVVTELRLLQAEAQAQGTTMRCVEGEFIVYLPWERALIPGHIYSDGGIKEARISHSCEYHFDRWFQPGWVDALTGEKGLTPPEPSLAEALHEVGIDLTDPDPAA